MRNLFGFCLNSEHFKKLRVFTRSLWLITVSKRGYTRTRTHTYLHIYISYIVWLSGLCHESGHMHSVHPPTSYNSFATTSLSKWYKPTCKGAGRLHLTLSSKHSADMGCFDCLLDHYYPSSRQTITN